MSQEVNEIIIGAKIVLLGGFLGKYGLKISRLFLGMISDY
jgi:hypothetical protein